MKGALRIHEPARPLRDTDSLHAFLGRVDKLPLDAKYQLVEQARLLLTGAYVHLPLKRAMHGIDPVQRLRLLEHRLAGFSDLQFHAELAGIFRSLRDLHTVYQLPDPYRGHVATLGFLVERWGEAGEPHFVVTKADRTLVQHGFQVGAEITTWNGVPIDRAVEINADLQAGSNADARLARGLEALTLRSLRTGPPPDEHRVVVGYRAGDGGEHEARFEWRVRAAVERGGRAHDGVSALSFVLGIDAGNEATRQIKRALFAPTKARAAEAGSLRSVLDHRELDIGGRRYGYLRIYSFNVASARRFVEQVAQIVAKLPRTGLIIDIRGNPGGHVLAAEGTLQLLSRGTIRPATFSMATTALALDLCGSNPTLRRWASSIQEAVETGEAYSQAFPLSDPRAIADGLPRYKGPKVLITDALCYSAADMFAAGAQDNGVCKILGTTRHTGAGGANVWTHEMLRLWLPETLGALPAGAGFRVALRRSTRVGLQVGVPLEDLGVQADEVHALTRRDVTDRNQDLLAAAATLLRR